MDRGRVTGECIKRRNRQSCINKGLAGHMHTHAHTRYIPLYCYSYSLSYNRPNKEMNTIFRMLLKIDLTRVQYLCSKY